MGRGGKQGAGSAALAEAQSLMLHSRLDDAAATALTALGAPPAASSSAWEEVIDELPPAKKPTESVVQLSCIAIQSALRLGKAESAAAIAGALYAPQGADAGAVAAAAAAPVEVALSLAHGLASSDRRDDAEKVVRARLKAGGSKGGNGSDTPPGSPSKSAARSDGALLTEYLLFHLLCPPTPAGTALADPAKRIKAVEGARKFLKGKDSPKLPKPVKDAFTGRLDAFTEEAEAALKLTKDEEKKRKRAAATAAAATPAAPPVAAAPGTPAAAAAASSGGGGERRSSARKKERSIGRQVQPAYEPPPPSFAVRLLRAILTVKGIGSIGVLAVVSYFLSKSALGRWLYIQLDGMWQLATSVRM
jgi:hypothetical protein